MRKNLISFNILLIIVTLLSIFYSYMNNTGIISINEENSHELYDKELEISGPNLEWQNSTGDFVESVALSANGNYVAVGSVDTYIYLFDTSTGNQIWNYSTSGIVDSVVISSDGTYIAAGSQDNKVYLLNNTPSIAKTPMWEYSSAANINSVDISSNGYYIAAGNNNNEVFLFNRTITAIKSPMWTYTTLGAILSVAISSEGNYIVAGNNNNEILLFNNLASVSKTTVWNITTFGTVNEVAISSDGSYIAAGNNDELLYLLSKSSSTPIWIADVGGQCLTVDISSNGEYIVAGTDNQEMLLYHKSSSNDLWNNGDFNNNNVLSVAISYDGNYIVAGDDNNDIYYFDRLSSKRIDKDGVGGWVQSVSISADGKTYVGGSQDTNVYLYTYSTPGGFTLTSNAKSPDEDATFRLSWSQSASAENYTIYRDNNVIDDVDNTDMLVEGLTNSSYLISGLISDDYYYIMMASNESTGDKYSNSIKVSVRIPPGAFKAKINADDPDTDGLFDLTWSVSDDAISYTIYIHDEEFDEINDDVKIIASGVTGLSFSLFGIPTGKYFIRVEAYNLTGRTLSNTLEVDVQIPGDSLLDTANMILLAICVSALVAAIFAFNQARGSKKALNEIIQGKDFKKLKERMEPEPTKPIQKGDNPYDYKSLDE